MLPTRNVKPLITKVKEVFPIENPDSIELFILIVVSLENGIVAKLKWLTSPLCRSASYS
jgi:hypothetical protein